jgi:HAD superfamily hydrolase (TIGR01493 family)
VSGPISSYVFDAYGTLFDVHSAVRRHADKAGPNGRAFSELWRAKQLEYSWVLSLSISPLRAIRPSIRRCATTCSTLTGNSTAIRKSLPR